MNCKYFWRFLYCREKTDFWYWTYDLKKHHRSAKTLGVSYAVMTQKLSIFKTGFAYSHSRMGKCDVVGCNHLKKNFTEIFEVSLLSLPQVPQRVVKEHIDCQTKWCAILLKSTLLLSEMWWNVIWLNFNHCYVFSRWLNSIFIFLSQPFVTSSLSSIRAGQCPV